MAVGPPGRHSRSVMTHYTRAVAWAVVALLVLVLVASLVLEGIA